MTHLRKIYLLMMVSAVVATVTNVAYAGDRTSNSTKSTKTSKAEQAKTEKTNTEKVAKKTAGTKTTARNGSAVAGQTDIVAKVDLPMVTNITPWRDAEESAPKNILEFSALKDSLTPTDRDRLAGEIRYTSILNQPVEQK